MSLFGGRKPYLPPDMTPRKATIALLALDAGIAKCERDIGRELTMAEREHTVDVLRWVIGEECKPIGGES